MIVILTMTMTLALSLWLWLWHSLILKGNRFLLKEHTYIPYKRRFIPSYRERFLSESKWGVHCTVMCEHQFRAFNHYASPRSMTRSNYRCFWRHACKWNNERQIGDVLARPSKHQKVWKLRTRKTILKSKGRLHKWRDTYNDPQEERGAYTSDGLHVFRFICWLVWVLQWTTMKCDDTVSSQRVACTSEGTRTTILKKKGVPPQVMACIYFDLSADCCGYRSGRQWNVMTTVAGGIYGYRSEICEATHTCMYMRLQF